MRGMHTNIDGQDIPVGVAYGFGHQIERIYEAGGDGAMRWPAGTTSSGLPWFRDLREAIAFLKTCPFPGRIQTYVLDPNNVKPSWITSGQYYSKPEGAMKDAIQQSKWIAENVRLTDTGSLMDSVSLMKEEMGGNWGEHPDFPVSDWQAEVANDDDRRGYWEWVSSKLEELELEDENTACPGPR